MKQFYYLSVLNFGLIFLAHAQDKASDVKSNDPFAGNAEEEYTPPIIIQSIEYIEVSMADTTRLLFDENLITDSVKLREALGVMLKDGTAKMFDTVSTVSRATAKTSSESIAEMIYPTEYEPGEIPSSVMIPEKQASNPELMKALGILRTQATPTAFEPRNIGSSLETETTLNEAETVADTRQSSEFVQFSKWLKYNEEIDVLGNHNDIRMPLFYVMRISNNISVPVGKPQYIGLHSAKGDDGQLNPNKKIIAISRCHVIKTNTNKK